MREDDSARDDRSGEWRHACFVNAGDQSIALRPEVDLEAQQEVKSLPFGTVFFVSSADAFRELVGALSLINFESFK